MSQLRPGRASSAQGEGAAWIGVRGLLLALGLLLPLNLPFSLPSVRTDLVLGWSVHEHLHPTVTEQVVSHATWHARVVGLLPGDVLIEVNGEPAEPTLLKRVRAQAQPGDTIRLLIQRGEERRSFDVPVTASSASYSGYQWFRLVLALVSWLAAMTLLVWRADRAGALPLGAALLLVAPVTFPGGVTDEGLLLSAARLGWQLQAAAYRFLFPTLLLHFLALSWPGARRFRSPLLWSLIYAGQLAALLLVTHGFGNPLAYSSVGPDAVTRTAVGLVSELAVVAAALVFLRSGALANPLRWLILVVLVFTFTGATLSLLLLAGAERSHVEVLRQVKSIATLLLPVAAAIHYFVAEADGGEWHGRRRVATSASVLLVGLYGFAVAGAAAIVLSATGRDLGGVEVILFGVIFAAAIVFSPVLRWAREMVDRHLFARWAEVESQARSFVDRVGGELQPSEIAARVTRELPLLFQVASAELVVVESVGNSWTVEGQPSLKLLPRAALLAELASSEDTGRVALAPVHRPDGELIGLLRLGRRIDGRAFDGPEYALLRTVAQGVAAALRNAEGYLALRQAQHELAEAERIASMGALAGGLAHEIKNPLAGLKMGLYLLERGGADPERIRRIQWDLRRIDDLVSGLLRYTHERSLEAVEAVDLRALVAECVAEVRSAGEGNGVSLREHYPEEPVVAVTGRSELRLAVSNLLVNAMEAIGDEGTVDIGVDTCEDRAEIWVRDDGPGIEPAIRDRIFDLNFSTKPGGSGLGLALARREVERVGGSIAVDTPCGTGTGLRIALPRMP